MRFISPRLICRCSFLLTMTVACLAGARVAAGQTPNSPVAAGNCWLRLAPQMFPQQGTASEARVKIGPGDLIEVNVYDEDDLDQSVRINDLGDGTFNFIGSLHLAELTTDQAAALIARQTEGRELPPCPPSGELSSANTVRREYR